MRKVKLRMNEEYKYNTIKKLVDTNGSKKAAALKLKCSIRTINRLIIKYKQLGKSAFVHGNRGRLPLTTIPLDTKNTIISLYLNEYSDTNFRHFSEIIKEDHNISISDTTINNWLRDHSVLSPKAHKSTKKRMKKELKDKLKVTTSKKAQNDIKETIHYIDQNNSHARRPRCKYFGEMIQMDASVYEWIKGEQWHLHLSVDDSTGTVVGAHFDTQETLKAYYQVFYQILTNYGIPAMFYTDKRTVFEYTKKNRAFDDEDTFTQFSYACHTLGVDIKTTSVAQAKGRVERLNQTFQSRLPIELRRAHISDIDAANKFLNSYIKKFNKQFALQVNSTKSVFEAQPTFELINKTLAVLSNRKVDAGHCIKYKNNYYQPKNEKGVRYDFKKGSDCVVIESFDGNLYGNILDTIYILDKLDDHEQHSKEFDAHVEQPIKKQRYIPPLDHPWRIDNIHRYFGSQKHRQIGADV